MTRSPPSVTRASTCRPSAIRRTPARRQPRPPRRLGRALEHRAVRPGRTARCSSVPCSSAAPGRRHDSCCSRCRSGWRASAGSFPRCCWGWAPASRSSGFPSSPCRSLEPGAWAQSHAQPLAHTFPIAEPPPLVHEAGFVGWVKASLLDPVGWRTALYLLLAFPLSIVGFALAVVLWPTAVVLVPLLVATPWVVRGLARLNRILVRELLTPVPLSERVRRLQQSRDQAVDTAAADLRRIERDLHDGAQARLVALAMDLGMAKEKLTTGGDPQEASHLVTDAHDEAKRALGELRDLVRGIHPAVLTDRGLDAALSALVSHASVPVSLTVDPSVTGPQRPRPAIEAIAYFAASELLVNTSKHSSATAAWTRVYRDGATLALDVVDDGRGGADPLMGTGLSGLSERVESVEGRLLLDSPPGGPTKARVELPCES